MKTPRPEHALDKTPAASDAVEVLPPAPEELIVTSCPEHGIKAAQDFRSFIAYVCMAYAHRHAGEHDDGPATCWVCCDDMVIDPAHLATVGEVLSRGLTLHVTEPPR